MVCWPLSRASAAAPVLTDRLAEELVSSIEGLYRRRLPSLFILIAGIGFEALAADTNAVHAIARAAYDQRT